MILLPYRPNVVAALFTRDGLVFVPRRPNFPHADGAAWGGHLQPGARDGG